MDFRITMTVSETQLGGVLARFNKSQLADMKLEPITQTKAVEPVKTNGRSPVNKKLTGKPSSRVCLGDTCHQVGGDVSRAIVQLLEKMEAKDGIGTATRKTLAAEAARLGISNFPGDAIMSMLKAGHLVIVGED